MPSADLSKTARWVTHATLPGLVEAAMIDHAKAVFVEEGLPYPEHALREKLAAEILRDTKTYADTFLRLVAADATISTADPATVDPAKHQPVIRAVVADLWTRVSVELLLPRI